jgi:uncharacterized pyridoxamine 5'-phosphate oxidase family protein
MHTYLAVSTLVFVENVAIYVVHNSTKNCCNNEVDDNTYIDTAGLKLPYKLIYILGNVSGKENDNCTYAYCKSSRFSLNVLS